MDEGIKAQSLRHDPQSAFEPEPPAALRIIGLRGSVYFSSRREARDVTPLPEELVTRCSSVVADFITLASTPGH